MSAVNNSAPPVAAGDLTVLLDTEARLEESLERARARAEDIVAEANAKASDTTNRINGETNRRKREMIRSIERETDQRLRSLEVDHAALLERYRAVEGAKLDALAARMSLRVVEWLRGKVEP